MTSTQIRTMLGDTLTPAIQREMLELVSSANADRHETAEWLPRYKLALALLANTCGLYDGAIGRLASAYEGQPTGETLKGIQTEACEFWAAHLRCVADAK